MGLSDLTLQLIAFRLLALLILVALQGAIVAAAAVALGDNGPKYDGRLTVSPASHVDPLGVVGMIIFGLGWGKPMDIDAGQLRTGLIGVVVIILAGFLGLLATAALLDALVRPALTALPHTAALTTAAFLRTAASLAIWFALLSLVPVPPLTAGLLLGALGIRVPRPAQTVFAGLLLVAVATGVVRELLGPAHAVLAATVFGQ